MKAGRTTSLVALAVLALVSAHAAFAQTNGCGTLSKGVCQYHEANGAAQAGTRSIAAASADTPYHESNGSAVAGSGHASQ